MKKVVRLELENEQLRLESKKLREELARKDREIERLKFGKHVIKGHIVEMEYNCDYDSVYGDYMYKVRGYSEYTFKTITNEFPLELWQKLSQQYNRNNARLKFTVELDNE